MLRGQLNVSFDLVPVLLKDACEDPLALQVFGSLCGRLLGEGSDALYRDCLCLDDSLDLPKVSLEVFYVCYDLVVTLNAFAVGLHVSRYAFQVVR